MKTAAQELFVLENFEGSLEFLMQLIQKEEIPILEVNLRELTSQFMERFAGEIDGGAEFVGSASSLLLWKSRELLPREEQGVEEEEDTRFAIIHQLLDYCRFKEAAKGLEERERGQGAYYVRGYEAEVKKNLGIDHLSLEDLGQLFQKLLSKVQEKKRSIEEEEWRVSDKVEAICFSLERAARVSFEDLFRESMGRLELIVTFLALLELMKRGVLRVLRVQDEVRIEKC
jgi:segregation and condensation protein A